MTATPYSAPSEAAQGERGRPARRLRRPRRSHRAPIAGGLLKAHRPPAGKARPHSLSLQTLASFYGGSGEAPKPAGEAPALPMALRASNTVAPPFYAK